MRYPPETVALKLHGAEWDIRALRASRFMDCATVLYVLFIRRFHRIHRLERRAVGFGLAGRLAMRLASR